MISPPNPLLQWSGSSEYLIIMSEYKPPEFYKALGETEQWPDITGAHPSSLTYDNVLLVPQFTEVDTRGDVSLAVDFGPFKLQVPIISAPMDTVTGEQMARELDRIGAISALPRGSRGELDRALAICERLSTDDVNAVYSVGLASAVDDAVEYSRRGAKMILIDVANGGMKKVIKAVGDVRDNLPDMTVAAGNIATYALARLYKEKGVHIARVGVGPGGVCQTRLVAGSGFPQLSAVFETVAADISVIADGGIKHPGDVAKALAARAKVVMIGSLFGGTDESAGYKVDGGRVLRGQASEEYMVDNGGGVNEFRAAEGIATVVPDKGPVVNIVNQITGGVRSAMSYAGAHDLQEFPRLAKFVLVSDHAGREGSPHVLNWGI